MLRSHDWVGELLGLFGGWWCGAVIVVMVRMGWDGATRSGRILWLVFETSLNDLGVKITGFFLSEELNFCGVVVCQKDQILTFLIQRECVLTKVLLAPIEALGMTRLRVNRNPRLSRKSFKIVISNKKRFGRQKGVYFRWYLVDAEITWLGWRAFGFVG